MTRFPRLSLFAAAGLCLAAATHAQPGFDPALPPAPAPTPAPTDASAPAPISAEQQFKNKLRERDRAYRKLYRLDAQAAAAVKRGEQPLELFAQQQSTQEILNGLELRLTLTASRHGWEVSAPPARPGTRIDRPDTTPQDRAAVLADSISPEGPARTRALIRREVHAMLAALAFRGYPQNGGR